jgi:TonB family protein
VAVGVSLGAHLALVAVAAAVLPRAIPEHGAQSREAIDLVSVEMAPAALESPAETVQPAHSISDRSVTPRRSPVRAFASVAPQLRGQKPLPDRPAASAGSAVAAVAPAADDYQEPARFVLSAQTAITPGVENGLPSSAGSPARDATGGENILPEHAADQPTRVLSQPRFAYPPAARQAEVEADVELEIVVGRDGRVLAARALSHAGYGLEQAAAQGVLAYRFLPARRAGHPVSVRRKWVMEFRLR